MINIIFLSTNKYALPTSVQSISMSFVASEYHGERYGSVDKTLDLGGGISHKRIGLQMLVGTQNPQLVGTDVPCWFPAQV